MIDSISNAQVKNIMQLQKKSRVRNEQHLFVAEGVKMVAETPIDRLEKVYIAQSFNPEKSLASVSGSRLSSWLAQVPAETVSDRVFKELSQTQTPQGMIAVVKMLDTKLETLLKNAHKGCYLVLETIQDPGNLGTIVRTAEGAGVDGIILNRTCVDIYNPKVIRSTMGALYRVPFVYVDDLHATLRRMKERGICLYAAHLKGKTDYYQQDYTSGCGFLIGNEAGGLTNETAALADTYIKIPMCGQLESLNAAMAAGLLIYEARRQRNLNQM